MAIRVGANYIEIDGYTVVQGCEDLSKKLVENPLSVMVDASKMVYYVSGIFNSCGDTVNINHLMTLVAETDSYWMLKNEWGANWGEKGVIRIAKGNMCGVCYQGVIPFKK